MYQERTGQCTALSNITRLAATTHTLRRIHMDTYNDLVVPVRGYTQLPLGYDHATSTAGKHILPVFQPDLCSFLLPFSVLPFCAC